MSKKYNTEIFINKSREIHGGKYKYNKVNYKNTKTKVTITCNKHGDFDQRPCGHLTGYGCRKCAKEKIIHIENIQLIVT